MKCMAENVGEVIRPGAHRHVSCSALHSSHRYEYFNLKQKKARDSTRRNSNKGRSDSEKSKSVEL